MLFPRLPPPVADVRFSFLGSTSLADWRMSHEERLAAMHTHWGGAAFWAPPNCPSLLAGGGALNRSPSGGVGSFGGRTPPALPMAAAARPDTARGPRPSASRQASRLSISSSASAELAGTPPTLPAASSGSMGGGASGPLPSARSSLGSGRKQQQSAVSGYEADSGAMTARRPPPAAAGLSELSMDQVWWGSAIRECVEKGVGWVHGVCVCVCVVVVVVCVCVCVWWWWWCVCVWWCGVWVGGWCVCGVVGWGVCGGGGGGGGGDPTFPCL